MTHKYKDRLIIGPVEKITIDSKNGEKELVARIDTGASRSSIDSNLAADLMLGPIQRTKLIKSVHGSSLRPMVDVQITLACKKIVSSFTIADRTKMKYKVLIGRDILKNGFLIDPSKDESCTD